jgi:DNA helicase-2/ATP-dependent DNA helicase PcrA
MSAFPWELGMNDQQLQAIHHQDGPCVLLASAGSGKTRALVHRVARMVYDGTPADSILGVTFSKKAADEMNKRLKQLGVKQARIGTWHSLCLQILREDHTRWAEWKIDDTDRAKFLLKDALGFKHVNWIGADLGAVQRYIGTCKANIVWPGSDASLDRAVEQFGDGDSAMKADEAYVKYQELIENQGLLTFDDFLMFAWKHLTEGNRERWAARWKYLLQDEAQDASKIQVSLAEMLAREHRNYLVVGDTSQAIYSFRGSTPKYLADFSKEWSATEIVMHRNYRSGSAIVRVANDIIRPAETRLPVDMTAERPEAGSVTVVPCETTDDEGHDFAKWVSELQADGTSLRDCVALYRVNAQSRALEEFLINRKVPYLIVGGGSFYDRREVRDLLAYLRVASGADDSGESVARCINSPFRFLGKAFVERVQQLAQEAHQQLAGKPMPWSLVVSEAASQLGVQRRQTQGAEAWVRIIDRAQVQVATERPAAILDSIITETRYIEWLDKDEGQESVENSHGANVRELVRLAGRFATTKELLEYIEQMMRAAKRQREDRGAERVLLMSIHRSKGLEWPNVWVCGCNEKLLPHVKGDPEEERRLMYVACTRARDRLVLSYLKGVASRSGVVRAMPSRFLVDAGLVKLEEDF